MFPSSCSLAKGGRALGMRGSARPVLFTTATAGRRLGSTRSGTAVPKIPLSSFPRRGFATSALGPAAAPKRPTITFSPKPQSQLDEYTILFEAIPGTKAAEAPFELAVFGRDTLAFLRTEIAKGLGAPSPSSIALLVNGMKVPSADLEARQISSLFGNSLAVELQDGLRFNINAGQRITKMGGRGKRNLAKSYMYMGAGAAAAFGLALATWRAVVPEEKQRLY